MSALPPVLIKRHLAIFENPPNWLSPGEQTSSFIPSAQDFSQIIAELQEIQSELNELRMQWMPDERRNELNILLEYNLNEIMARHIFVPPDRGLTDASLGNEFMHCTYLKHFQEKNQNSHGEAAGDPWDERLGDRVNDKLAVYKERIAALDFLLQALYWNTFALTGITFGEQILALDFWRKAVHGKIEDVNNELSLIKEKPTVKDWLDLGLEQMRCNGDLPDSNPEIKKAWRTGKSQDLPANLRGQYLSFFASAYDEYSNHNRLLRQKYMLPEDHDRWIQWQRDYFENRLIRARYASNLLEALRINEAPSRSPSNYTDTSAHGFIYFVKNGDLFKIGITQNLLSRMSQVRPDEILNVVRCANYREIERALHLRFKEVRLPQSEYFRLSVEQVEHVHSFLAGQAKFF